MNYKVWKGYPNMTSEDLSLYVKLINNSSQIRLEDCLHIVEISGITIH